MRCWIGKFIFIIGLIHTILGFLFFRSVLSTIIREGLVNTVNGQMDRELTFWFIAFGIFSMIFGWFVDWVERQKIPFPRFLGWSLLLFTIILLVIMPISGGWLLLVPSIGAIRRS